MVMEGGSFLYFDGQNCVDAKHWTVSKSLTSHSCITACLRLKTLVASPLLLEKVE